jgi:hypothetical protein
MTVGEFQREVDAGRLPKPSMFGTTERWSRVQIDQMVEPEANDVARDCEPHWRLKQPLYAQEGADAAR